jgi:hypothetical protein
VLLCLSFRLIERRSIFPKQQRISSVCIVLLCGIGLTLAIQNFQQTGQHYRDLSAFSTPPSTAQFSHYTLETTIDPTDGSIGGQATFVITPSTSGEKNLLVALNPGLAIEQIKLSEDVTGTTFSQSIRFTSSMGWTTLQLAPTAFAQGKPLHLQLTYQGHFELNRDNYSSANAGRVSDIRNIVTNYLGQGLGFLAGNGGGNWYPLPWTNQVEQYGSRIPMDKTVVRLPASLQVASALTTPHLSADQRWQTIELQKHEGLPLAFLATLANPDHTMIAGIPVYYNGLEPAGIALQSYEAVIHHVLALEQWLRPEVVDRSQWQAVIVPFLMQPIVSTGLLLLPEQPLLSNTHLFNLKDPAILLHLFGYKTVVAWWHNLLHGETIVQKIAPSGQRPQGTTAFETSSSQTEMMLADYSSAVITDKLAGNNFFAQKKEACEQIGQGDITNLGTYCVPQTRALYHLQQKDGADAVTKILQQVVSTEAGQVGNWQQFLNTVNTILQRDTTTELRPYLCVSKGSGSSDCIQEKK